MALCCWPRRCCDSPSWKPSRSRWWRHGPDPVKREVEAVWRIEIDDMKIWLLYYLWWFMMIYPWRIFLGESSWWNSRLKRPVSANFWWIPFRRAGDGFSLHSGILKPCETEIRSSRSLLFFGKTFGKPRSHSDLDIPVFSWAKLLIFHPPRRLAERIAEFQGLLGTPQTRLELESSRLANKKWRR